MYQNRNARSGSTLSRCDIVGVPSKCARTAPLPLERARVAVVAGSKELKVRYWECNPLQVQEWVTSVASFSSQDPARIASNVIGPNTTRVYATNLGSWSPSRGGAGLEFIEVPSLSFPKMQSFCSGAFEKRKTARGSWARVVCSVVPAKAKIVCHPQVPITGRSSCTGD